MPLSEMIRMSPIASVISNPRMPDNPIIDCNEGFSSLTGYERGEIVGRNCRFLAGPETEPWLTQMIRNGVHTKRAVLVEIRNYKRDGTPFRNAVLVAPIFGETGDLEYFLGSQVEMEEDAVVVQASIRRRSSAAKVAALTARQRAVLIQMALGQLNKQIAHTLGLSERTVKMHRAALLDALSVHSNADAIRIAIEAGY